MDPNLRNDVKSRLAEKLGREPTATRLTDGQFVADYFRHGAPVRDFIGETQDECFASLLRYLEAREVKTT